MLSLLADAHNEPRRFERYLEMLLDRRVEALIVIANWLVMDIKLLADVTRRQVPTVIVGREIDIDTANTVAADNEAGAAAALDHLFCLGHRDIAFMRGPGTQPAAANAGRASAPTRSAPDSLSTPNASWSFPNLSIPIPVSKPERASLPNFCTSANASPL